MKELEDCLREALEESPYGIVTNDTALETARKYASELLRQRDELKEALAEQKRLYFNLFDEEIRCMYCENLHLMNSLTIGRRTSNDTLSGTL